MAEKTSAPLAPAGTSSDFIREIIQKDLASGKHRQVVTRFPPEPNGYLHIGHAKAICLNFTLAQEFGGRCHLRYDDTNPVKEEQEYIEAIQRDVAWLGFHWGEHLYFASDYFEQMYQWAEKLIRKGLAYVCDCSPEELREKRGTLTEPGVPCPHRTRSVEENLQLFRRMRAGEFPDGSRVLRAKIDMAHGNVNLRDPVMYRILHVPHPHAGAQWCIYPMYDYAHPLEDAIEGITHSICTLEFEDHRPLYDWFIDQLELPEPHPQQIEFARLNLTYTVMSKRRLLALVTEGIVDGWDDPRMPTIAGLRRRGVPPEAIRLFAERIGVAKRNSVVDVQLLEHCIREVLNRTAPRRFAVLDPVPLTITNYPEGQVEWFPLPNNPEDPAAGTRQLAFTKHLWVEREDVRPAPVPKYFRLFPGNEVRLRGAYLLRCTEVRTDPSTGQVVEVLGEIDPDSRGGQAPGGRKVGATLHWLSQEHARPAEVRLFEYLFTKPDPDEVEEGGSWRDNLNPNSRLVLSKALVEPSLLEAPVGAQFQFERLGYFAVDPDSTPSKPVFNRIVTLKDEWAKVAAKMKG